jgi:hypothetical protein
MLYEADGYWHRAEFIRGKGEVVKVLTKNGTAISTDTSDHVMDAINGVDWGDQDTDDQPRVINRKLKTYKRTPNSFLPFRFYTRTSVGFVCNMLGIQMSNIRTPADLFAYCENDAVEMERNDAQLQAA